nr:DNA binding protein [Microvirus sp.]
MENQKNEKEIQILFSVRDRLADEFSEPRLFVNKAIALRWFADVLHKTTFPADDFELLAVGEFDMERGIITGYEKPEFLQRGLPDEV